MSSFTSSMAGDGNSAEDASSALVVDRSRHRNTSGSDVDLCCLRGIRPIRYVRIARDSCRTCKDAVRNLTVVIAAIAIHLDPARRKRAARDGIWMCAVSVSSALKDSSLETHNGVGRPPITTKLRTRGLGFAWRADHFVGATNFSTSTNFSKEMPHGTLRRRVQTRSF